MHHEILNKNMCTQAYAYFEKHFLKQQPGAHT